MLALLVLEQVKVLQERAQEQVKVLQEQVQVKVLLAMVLLAMVLLAMVMNIQHMKHLLLRIMLVPL